MTNYYYIIEGEVKTKDETIEWLIKEVEKLKRQIKEMYR